MSTPGRFAVGALAVAALGAVVLPGARLGVGVPLVALAFAALAWPVLPDRWSRGWLGLALALAAVPLVRDAQWVVVPALGAAVALASLAVAGGRSWIGVGAGLGVLPLSAPWGPAAVARAARAALPGDAPGRLAPALRGAALAAGLVVVFGGLFASADRAFARLAGDALPTVSDLAALPLRAVVFAALLGLAGAIALVPRTERADPVPGRRLGTAEWVVALAALNGLFAAFVALQLAVLFGPDDHVRQTAGLTYADYAHAGFGQLLVAAALTLAVAAAALTFSPPGRRGAVRALLALLFVLTFVVLASALHRLGLYEEAFGATRLRFAARWALLVVGALLAVVLAALAAGRFGGLPRAAVLTCALAVLVGAGANPDRRIAEDNLARPGPVDRVYLGGLSADATPVLPAALSARQRARLADEDGWSGFNLARARARDRLR